MFFRVFQFLIQFPVFCFFVCFRAFQATVSFFRFSFFGEGKKNNWFLFNEDAFSFFFGSPPGEHLTPNTDRR